MQPPRIVSGLLVLAPSRPRSPAQARSVSRAEDRLLSRSVAPAELASRSRLAQLLAELPERVTAEPTEADHRRAYLRVHLALPAQRALPVAPWAAAELAAQLPGVPWTALSRRLSSPTSSGAQPRCHT